MWYEPKCWDIVADWHRYCLSQRHEYFSWQGTWTQVIAGRHVKSSKEGLRFACCYIRRSFLYTVVLFLMKNSYWAICKGARYVAQAGNENCLFVAAFSFTNFFNQARIISVLLRTLYVCYRNISGFLEYFSIRFICRVRSRVVAMELRYKIKHLRLSRHFISWIWNLNRNRPSLTCFVLGTSG